VIIESIARGDSILAEFANTVTLHSVAVMSLSINDLQVCADSERKVFSTYYERVQAGLQIPSGGKWDVLRGVAEHSLYQHQKNHIRFAALSLDAIGVKNYGACHLTLATRMIEHRTSVYEANNVIFTVFEQAAKMSDAMKLEAGHSSDWDHRAALCLAKLASKLTATTQKDDFPRLLIEQGATTEDDKFVELHVWGPITIRTVAAITIVRQRNRPSKTDLKDLNRKTTPFGIKVEIA
jgi:hypothetical protein